MKILSISRRNGSAWISSIPSTGMPAINRKEGLKSYADLAGWAKEANLISESRTQELLSEAAARPEEAHETLGKAIALREFIYRLFLAHLRVGNPQATDLKQTLTRCLNGLPNSPSSFGRMVSGGPGREMPSTWAASWDRSPSPQPACSPLRSWRGSGYARMQPAAGGCSMIPAATTAGVGVICKAAATGPRPGSIM